MLDRPGLDFSFSGLKTQVLLAWQQNDPSDATRAAIARGFQDCVAETLSVKCERAMKQTGMRALVVAGGVGANRALRERLHALAEKRRWRLAFPRLQFCTDNGAMIAFAGALRLQAGEADAELTVQPRWDMATLQPPGVAHG
jgi:N6-L-threonylcarbamoyladenine synthase